MNKLPFSLDALHAFEAAARLRSFKLAAAELNVTATAVSHRIRKLEEQLGKPLFVRKVREVALTEEGAWLLAAVSDGLAQIAAVIERIRTPARQTVRLSVTPAFAAKWLVPKLPAFQTAYPEIDLYVHTSYAVVDLNAGAADLAVRYGDGRFAGLQAEPLLQECFAPVASPSLLADLGREVKQWPLIHLEWHRPAQGAVDWNAWAQAAGVPPADVQGGIRYSDGGHAIQAAVAGQGVALLGLKLIKTELDLGLLQVAAEPQLPAQYYWLCEPLRRKPEAAVKVVKDWLLAQAMPV